MRAEEGAPETLRWIEQIAMSTKGFTIRGGFWKAGAPLSGLCAITVLIAAGCASPQASSMSDGAAGPKSAGEFVRKGLLPPAADAEVDDTSDAPLSAREFAELAGEVERAYEPARPAVEPDPQAPAKPAVEAEVAREPLDDGEFDDIDFEDQVALANRGDTDDGPDAADMAEEAPVDEEPVQGPPEPAVAVGNALEVTLASLKTVVFQATVDQNGNIELPLVDRVAVGGLNYSDAAGSIRRAYLAAGIYDTRLQVTVRANPTVAAGDGAE